MGHPVYKGENINNWKDIKQSKKLERGQLNCEQRSKLIKFAKLKKCQCLFNLQNQLIYIYKHIYRVSKNRDYLCFGQNFQSLVLFGF